MVTAEVVSSSTLSDDTTTTIVEPDEGEGITDNNDQEDTPTTEELSDAQESMTPDNEESPVCMISTACGDYHNLGLDTTGQAYSLPSPLHFSSIPGGAQQKVVEIVCGKVASTTASIYHL